LLGQKTVICIYCFSNTYDSVLKIGRRYRVASLSVTRGDTLPIIVNIDSNGEPYELEEGDIITFTVKKTTDINDAVLIQKQMDKNTGLYCELTPQDTKLPYGKYKYDVQLSQSNGRVFTIIKPSTFVVTEEVTTNVPS